MVNHPESWIRGMSSYYVKGQLTNVARCWLMRVVKEVSILKLMEDVTRDLIMRVLKVRVT